MSEKKYRFDTIAVRGGYETDKSTGACAVPIYQTSSYVFHDTEHAANLFALKESGNIYTRIMNPTQDVFEKRIAELEGGIGALATSSGQAAITTAILNIANSGDEIVASSSLYGGTYNLFSNTLPKLGIKVHFVDSSNPENFRAVINDKTKAIYAEVIGNPQIDVLDIEVVANIAHESSVPLIVDNTFGTPYLIKPFDFGADIIIHSTTKFIGGHGTSIGGIIIDSGKFNWDNGKFLGLTEPDHSYHGVSYVRDIGAAAYIMKARVQLMRDMGLCASPFNSFLLIQGLETLHLRMQRHCENAIKIAKFLYMHELVSWVNYPGLSENINYDKAQKYLPKGQGAILTFGISGGYEAAKKFIDSLQLFMLVANVGDARSLVIHPASTTHQQLTEEQQISSGVSADMIRLSIGIEDIEDLIEDLDQALRKSHI